MEENIGDDPEQTLSVYQSLKLQIFSNCLLNHQSVFKENGIFGEGFQIFTNQKHGNTVISLMIG